MKFKSDTLEGKLRTIIGIHELGDMFTIIAAPYGSTEILGAIGILLSRMKMEDQLKNRKELFSLIEMAMDTDQHCQERKKHESQDGIE